MTNLLNLMPAVGLGYGPSRLLDRFLEGWERPAVTLRTHGAWIPPTDIAETEKEYVLNMEMPGADMKSLDITFAEGVLTIKGEKGKEIDEGMTSHLEERYTGPFERSFRVPEGVNGEKIQASYTDGVLRVLIPKPEESVPRKIEVH